MFVLSIEMALANNQQNHQSLAPSRLAVHLCFVFHLQLLSYYYTSTPYPSTYKYVAKGEEDETLVQQTIYLQFSIDMTISLPRNIFCPKRAANWLLTRNCSWINTIWSHVCRACREERTQLYTTIPNSTTQIQTSRAQSVTDQRWYRSDLGR
jgi:hypothetical protein